MSIKYGSILSSRLITMRCSEQPPRVTLNHVMKFKILLYAPPALSRLSLSLSRWTTWPGNE
jgi:hypothetical protein